MRGKRIAILGATGLVGGKVLEILQERNFPVASLRLLATARSQGTNIRAMGEEIKVEEARPTAFDGIDLCFFAASATAARQLAPEAVKRGAVVIDKSNAYRMDTNVPLIVPEVNGHRLREHRGIISSPNCSTIQLVVTLKPLEDSVGINRVIATTYQSVSGTGKDAMDELSSQSADVLAGKPPVLGIYPKQIAFNLLPHIDNFMEAGYTGEEWKMVKETRKIMERPDLRVTATCVRVPVFISHSEAVLVETKRPLSPEKAREILRAAPGVEVIDEPDEARYPVPVEAAASDKVFVGRIRRDTSSENGLWLWIVSDNLRKGAATNAVQIAESLIEHGLV